MYRPTLGDNFVATLDDFCSGVHLAALIITLYPCFIYQSIPAVPITREIAGHLHTFVLILGQLPRGI